MKLLAFGVAALLCCAAVNHSHAMTSGMTGANVRPGRTGTARGNFSRPALPGAALPGLYPRPVIRTPTLRGRFRDRSVIGVPAFVPIPDLAGYPFYDGFAYPYFLPGALPYAGEYAAPWLPPAGSINPQTEYIPQLPPPVIASDGAGQQIWYYCQDPMGYYPYVRDCNADWQAVPASVLPPPEAE